MTLGESRKKGEISYTNTLMGSTETVFSHYRMIYFLEHVRDDGKLLLDIGCGAGNKIKNISRFFYCLKIVGIDLSRAALMCAHKNEKRAHFLSGDAEKLPIRGGSVDYVVSFDLLEHLPNPEKAIEEFHRALKKGGVFHSFVPCEGERLSIIGRSRRFRSLTMRYSGHIQRFTKKQIKLDLKNVGFTVIDEKHSYFYFAQLVYLLSYLVLGGRPEREGTAINLVRSVGRILVSKADLKLSNRFPNYSVGYHITARK